MAAQTPSIGPRSYSNTAWTAIIGWNGMGCEEGMGLGVTDNELKMMGGRIKINRKRVRLRGGVIVK